MEAKRKVIDTISEKLLSFILNRRKKQEQKNNLFSNEFEMYKNLSTNNFLREYVETKVKVEYYNKIIFTFFISFFIALFMGFINNVIYFVFKIFTTDLLKDKSENGIFFIVILIFTFFITTIIFMFLACVFSRYNNLKRKMIILEIIKEEL